MGSARSVCGVHEEGGVYLAMRREATLRLGEGEGSWEVLPLQGRWRVMTHYTKNSKLERPKTVPKRNRNGFKPLQMRAFLNHWNGPKLCQICDFGTVS